jgi:transcriptional regulator with XRE-family HTH domain
MMAAVEPDEWRATVGGLLRRARRARRMSKRGAAEAAGFSEALWRQIEDGERITRGVSVPANPRDENLEAAAKAVGLDPADVFQAAGRTYEPTGEPLSADNEYAALRDELEKLGRRIDEMEQRGQRS